MGFGGGVGIETLILRLRWDWRGQQRCARCLSSGSRALLRRRANLRVELIVRTLVLHTQNARGIPDNRVTCCSPSCPPVVALHRTWLNVAFRPSRPTVPDPAAAALMPGGFSRPSAIYVPFAMDVEIGVAGCSIIARRRHPCAAVGLTVEPVAGGHGSCVRWLRRDTATRGDLHNHPPFLDWRVALGQAALAEQVEE